MTWDNSRIHRDDPRTFAEIINQTTTMFDVVLDTSKLSVADYLNRLREISAGIAGQPAFASLAADLTALDGLLDTLETKESDLGSAKSAVTVKTNLRDSAWDAADAKIKALVTEVGKLAPTEEAILAANLRIKSKPGPKPVPAQPAGLELTMGDEDGELSGHCNGEPGVVDFYEIQWTAADPLSPTPNWQHADTSKKSSFTLNNLPSGQKVWVRLRAVNARGKSTWSDPACKRVP